MTWQRITLAAVLGYVTVCGVPVSRDVSRVTPVTPSTDMQTRVAGISAALKDASPADRAIWASVWEKAAVVVSGDAVTTEVAFTDTRSLRGFTVLALDIAWRRIGGNQAGKYAGLREATEKALGGVVGMDVVPVTPDMRKACAEACKAIAWAGINKG